MDFCRPEEYHNSISGQEEILKELGRGDVNARSLEMYDQMRELYPSEVIRTAARECGQGGKDLGEVLKLLQSWKEKGLETRKDVENYVSAFHDQTALIRELRGIWGTDAGKAGKADRSLVSKWEKEFGFGRDIILMTAAYAAEARQPMAYLDRILTEYHDKGIRTPEQIKKERTKKDHAR